jgi:hypothetical protein
MANDRSSTDTTIDPANWADAAYLEDLAQWADAAVGFFPVHGEKFREIAIALRSGLNPGMREALERIRDFPVGGHTAAGAMALIARQALASPPPSQ